MPSLPSCFIPHSCFDLHDSFNLYTSTSKYRREAAALCYTVTSLTAFILHSTFIYPSVSILHPTFIVHLSLNLKVPQRGSYIVICSHIYHCLHTPSNLHASDSILQPRCIAEGQLYRVKLSYPSLPYASTSTL